MKTLKIENTSKETNFEAFNQLSLIELMLIKGGTDETPPEEEEGREFLG